MKKYNLLSICLLLGLAIGLYTCKPEEQILPDLTGTLMLGIELSDSNQPDGKIASNPRLSVVISIKNALGELIMDQEVLKLTKLKNEFITKPITFLAGNYEITDFFIIDNTDETIYMTPQSGSLLAYLVDTPVPIPFSIQMDNTTKVIPEVISTEKKSPKDFGYSSFAFNYLETFDFLIAVFIYNYETEEYELTKANLQVLADGTMVLDSTLYPGTIQITVPSKYVEYELQIRKTNFLTYSETFSENDLAAHFDEDDEGPLSIILDDGLILWNKLGSEDEISTSEFGPPLTFGMDIHEFIPGISGNAITIREGTYYNMQRLRNVIFEDLPQYLNTESGTIECYFKANELPKAYSNNPYRIFNGSYGLDAGISLQYHDYNDGKDPRMVFNLNFSGENNLLEYHGFEAHGHIGEWVHLAAVWDRNGIDGTLETMRIYINGEVEASTMQKKWGTTIGNAADIASGNDANIAGKFYMDELRIYSIAKTDFSDRKID